MDALVSANARAILNGAIGQTATYTPAGGSPVALRVLTQARRTITGHGWSGEYIDVYVHQSDVSPAIGDQFEIAGETWVYRPEASVTLEARVCGLFRVLPCSRNVKGAR